MDVSTGHPERHRALFLSDLHLGTLGCRADLILSFLEHNTADHIYLVGDIFDLWDPLVTRWGEAQDRIVALLRARAAAGSRLVYLAGNHDRAVLDFGPEGRAGISIFKAEPRALPYDFDLIERHPEGSQAFIPMSADPFLVIVADGPEATPRAFLTDGTQGINLRRGTWHGVLTPLAAPGLFAVVDRIGATPNLEEHRFASPWRVVRHGV